MSEIVLNKILNEVQGIKTEVQGMKTEMHGIHEEIDSMRKQIDENTQMIKAIYHRKEETAAKLEALSMNFNKLHGEVVEIKNDVAQLLEDQTSIHELLGEHEVSIRTLRRRSI